MINMHNSANMLYCNIVVLGYMYIDVDNSVGATPD